MTPRHFITSLLFILAMGTAGHYGGKVLAWMDATDRQVERASLEAYCTGVAVWSAEAGRGIAPERRTGHPDWRGTAAEDCPGMRPAVPTTERHLAQN